MNLQGPVRGMRDGPRSAPTIPGVITVVAMLETIPPDHTGHHPTRQTGEARASAPTYEQARDQIHVALEPGWRVLNLRTV